MPLKTTSRSLVLVAALAAAILLAMVPLAAALDVHHLLAAADRDGHHHSDFDLCQWVQYHGTSASAQQAVDLGQPWDHAAGQVAPRIDPFTGGEPCFHRAPRGPPLS